jgi:hypothetical protein
LVINAISLVAGVAGMRALAVLDILIAVGTVAWIPLGRMLRGRGVAGVRVTGSNPAASVAAALGCVGAALCLVVLAQFGRAVQTEFVPQENNGQIHGEVTFPVGTPLATTEAALGRVETAVMTLPNIDTVRTYAG